MCDVISCLVAGPMFLPGVSVPGPMFLLGGLFPGVSVQMGEGVSLAGGLCFAFCYGLSSISPMVTQSQIYIKWVLNQFLAFDTSTDVKCEHYKLLPWKTFFASNLDVRCEQGPTK